MPRVKPVSLAVTPDAYELFHNGSLSLSVMEQNGIRVDESYLHATMESNAKTISTLQAELRTDPIFRRWRRRFGERTNVGSHNQLAVILYDELGYECKRVTEKGKRSTEAEALSLINIPFVKKFLLVEKKKKVQKTFLKGIRTEVCDGYLHPSFNLASGGQQDDEKGGTRSYRSSSSSPNFQNFPVRDPEMGELVRKCFIPRKGRRIVEVDFSGIEVKGAGCYTRDPNLVKYIEDMGKSGADKTDMHRDTATQVFLCKPGEVSKDMRGTSKNKFVFPQFYGSYYINCAANLWDDQAKYELRLLAPGDDPKTKKPTGPTVREHLKSRGIKDLGSLDPRDKAGKGTYVKLLRDIEEHFWGTRFPVYAQWKEDWWAEYQRHGRFGMFTGFVVEGVYGKNDVTNYPIQGSSFHCTLWCINRIQYLLRKRRMKSLLVGQIHDSILGDCPDSEVDDFVQLCHRVMTKELPRAWDWITVPLEVEAEVCPLGGSWHDKKEYKIVAA